MTMRSALIVLLALGLSPAASATGHDHDHDGEALWEWAGVFTLEAGETYTWSASRGEEGDYADPEMQLLLMATDDSDSHGIHEKEADAETLWEASNIAELTSGQTIPIGQAVHLVFDQQTWASHYMITVPATGSYVFFAQHFPVEFEKEFHYLKDEHGNDIEPTAEEPEGAAEESSETIEHDDRWAVVILGSLATALPSLLIVVLAGPALLKLPKDFLPAISCFASGAIFAAAVFLMLPEGYLLAGVGKEEVDATWTWGTALMGGWFFSVCIHYVVDVGQAMMGVTPANQDAAKQVDEDAAPPPVCGGLNGIRWAVCAPVLFGDFCHNIVDGFVIGFAAKSCSMSLVTSIIVATVLHEMPQEFGDFVVLISKGRMPWVVAAVCNFLSALSAVMGAIIAYESEVTSQFEGLTLAFGAGVYLFVALSELGPAFLEAENKSPLAALARLGLFVIGTVLIGLVLLDHEHCIASAADGEAAGGGHHHH